MHLHVHSPTHPWGTFYNRTTETLRNSHTPERSQSSNDQRISMRAEAVGPGKWICLKWFGKSEECFHIVDPLGIWGGLEDEGEWWVEQTLSCKNQEIKTIAKPKMPCLVNNLSPLTEYLKKVEDEENGERLFRKTRTLTRSPSCYSQSSGCCHKNSFESWVWCCMPTIPSRGELKQGSWIWTA